MCTDADVAALLSLAMNATSKERKAAALTLAAALQQMEALPEQFGSIIADAKRTYGDDVAAEVRAIVTELRLG